jgi:hypothetical protein
MFPIAVYLHYQLAILDALENNKLTPERLRQIDIENFELIKALRHSESQLKSQLKSEQGDTPQQ